MNCTLTTHQPAPSSMKQARILMFTALLLSLPQLARSSSFAEGEFGLHGIPQLTCLLLVILLASKIEMRKPKDHKTRGGSAAGHPAYLLYDSRNRHPLHQGPKVLVFENP